MRKVYVAATVTAKFLAACYPRKGGRSMTWPQFCRWCLTCQPVRETRDVLRRRRLGWRP